MRQKYLSLLIMGSILCLMMMFVASPVFACTPLESDFALTFEDRVHNAPMILVGTVTKHYVTTYGSGYEFVNEVEVEVGQYLKGDGATIVRISGFGQGPDCLSSAPPVGEQRIFMVSGDPGTGLQAFYLGVHDAVWQASDENIQTAISITGENNAPSPMPLSQQIMRSLSGANLWLIASIVILIVLIMPLFYVLRRHSPRKSKAKRS